MTCILKQTVKKLSILKLDLKWNKNKTGNGISFKNDYRAIFPSGRAKVAANFVIVLNQYMQLVHFFFISFNIQTFVIIINSMTSLNKICCCMKNLYGNIK